MSPRKLLRNIGLEAGLLLIGIPVLLWTLIPIYHMFLFAISPKDAAFSGQLWPTNPTLRNFEMVFAQKHHFLYHFWLQMFNSLIISIGTAAITLFVATAAAFAISRLRMKGGRLVMNLALLTYFIPAAFLAVPMYKTMGMYGLLNNDWALVLAMATIASPYAIWILRQASDKLPVELDEAAMIDGASPFQLFRMIYSAADGAVADCRRYLCAAAGVERVSLRVPVAVEGHGDHPAGGAGQFPLGRRFALGTADDGGLSLRPAARRDLLRLPQVHVLRPHGRSGEG